MGGRGRGRGRGKASMNLEQLGVQKGEGLPDRVVGPPEIYPPLEYRPVQPTEERNLAESYLLVVKKEFREHMQNSQYYIQPGVKRADIERYSDRYQVLSGHRGQLNLNWSRFPKELHPLTIGANKKRKKTRVKPNTKKQKTSKDVNVTATLSALEEKEASVNDTKEDESEEDEEEGKVREEEELEEPDEELDEGNDYVNNYFDNGDNYLDEEDDALEEGGVF